LRERKLRPRIERFAMGVGVGGSHVSREAAEFERKKGTGVWNLERGASVLVGATERSCAFKLRRVQCSDVGRPVLNARPKREFQCRRMTASRFPDTKSTLLARSFGAPRSQLSLAQVFPQAGQSVVLRNAAHGSLACLAPRSFPIADPIRHPRGRPTGLPDSKGWERTIGCETGGRLGVESVDQASRAEVVRQASRAKFNLTLRESADVLDVVVVHEDEQMSR
jgi:hypothetical protein